MKKIISCLVLSLILSSFSCMESHAAHQHSDSCYTIQGAHSHSGDSTNGGGCYTTPIYHVHTGNSTNGGGCYTVEKTKTQTKTCTDTVQQLQGSSSYPSGKCNSCNQDTYFTKVPYVKVCPTTGQQTSTGSLSSCAKCGAITYDGITSGSSTHTVSYDVTYYELGCGKTEDTVESWEMGCGLEESAGTKVLTCTISESVDTPTQAPTPTPEQTPAPEPSKPADTKPETPEKEITADDFDFKVECELTDEGASVKIIPNNKDILADNPYSWDNGVSWNNSDTSIFSKNGTYYIAIKNTEGKIKYKKLDIDLKSTNFAVITEYAATLTDKEFIDIIQEDEEPVTEAEVEAEEEPVKKKSSAGKVFAIIGISLGCLLVMGGIGFLIFMLLFKSNAKVVDSESEKVVAKINLKKKGGKVAEFEANISDKILMSLEGGLIIEPSSSIINKYVGYTLIVKSSEGVIETEIAEKIDVSF